MNEKDEAQRKVNLQKIVDESGHKLHTEVVKLLEEYDYKTEISPYYVDSYTDKPREIDIVARKVIPVFEGSNEDNVYLVFALDCKHLKEDVVFWNFKNEKHHKALKMIGNEDQLIDKRGEDGFIYFRADKISRLFQSGSSRTSNDPISDPIYKACVQAINGTIFAREHSAGPALIYPIVVVDGPGKLYEAKNLETDISSTLVHIDYSYYSDRQPNKKPTREPFYVLIVRKEKLIEAITLLQNEANIMKLQQQEKLNEKLFNDRFNI
ncbi:MAG: hypothetical protein WC087_02660 [Candidatus Paceibacterota bacterium]